MVFSDLLPGGTRGLRAIFDLIVEFGPGADLITYIGLWQFLEDIFGKKIDLVTRKGLRNDMKEKVMQDLVLV